MNNYHKFLLVLLISLCSLPACKKATLVESFSQNYHYSKGGGLWGMTVEIKNNPRVYYNVPDIPKGPGCIKYQVGISNGKVIELKQLERHGPKSLEKFLAWSMLKSVWVKTAKNPAALSSIEHYTLGYKSEDNLKLPNICKSLANSIISSRH